MTFATTQMGNKAVRERQTPCDFMHLEFTRQKTKKERRKETDFFFFLTLSSKNRLLTLGDKLTVAGGEQVEGWEGIGEGDQNYIYRDGH